MNLKDQELELLERWLDDPSFINWAKRRDSQDMSIWENYFNRHPEHWELGKIAKELIHGIPFRSISVDQKKKEIALSRLTQALEAGQKVVPLPKIRSIQAIRAAASVALVLIAGGLIYFQYFHNPLIFIATDYGQQQEHWLPDGSLVTLNANSSIEYHARNPRAIRLNGEAFFEVEKKPQTHAKFYVWTEDLEVMVLGTAFNVNTRNDQTQVFLQEGKVKLALEALDSESIEMEPGDLIAYSKKSKQLSEKKKNVSLLENASWKEGSLIFKDTPLPEALSAIEAIYGIVFVLESQNLQQKVISGGVPIKNLEVTKITLSEVYGIRIREEGGRYFLGDEANE